MAGMKRAHASALRERSSIFLRKQRHRAALELLEYRRLLSIEPGAYVSLAHESSSLDHGSLKVQRPSGAAASISAGDRFEPNDARDLSTNLGVLGDRTEIDLSVHAPFNEDWYRFDASASGTATVDITFLHSQGDLELQVYDAADNLLDSSETGNSTERTSFNVNAGDSYYIYVFGYSSGTNPDYDLIVDAPGATEGFTADALEPNNSFSAPRNLGALGYHAELDLNIHQASNDDYYRFTAAASGTATVDVLFENAQGDIDLAVYNAAGDEIGLSESIEDSEQVSFGVTASQSYIVRVYGFDGAINPDYDLYITSPGPPGQIAGHKWNDIDGDRVWDSGEPGLAGWTIYVDANTNGQLDSGEPSTVTVSDNLITQVDETGSYTITGVSPGSHIVAEVPKPGWRQTYPHDLPDLLATSFDVDLTTLDAGDTASIDFSILNQGTATAQSFDLAFFLSKDPVITTADRNVGFLEDPIVLGAGQTYSDTVAIQLPAPGDAFWTGEGTYCLGLVSDDLLEVFESDEANNANRGESIDRKTVTIRNVEAANLPDLAGTAFNVVATTAAAGTSASLSYTIANLGTNPAEGFDLGFYISADPDIDPTTDRLLNYIMDPTTLAAGASSSATLNVTLPGPGDSFYNGDGIYYIGQYVDDAFEVPETSETNNANRGNGLDRDTITITGTEGVASQFHIVVNFPDNSLTASQKAVFTVAAQRWSQVITGDLPDVNVAGHGLVDDLVINATAPAIDGVGSTLGQAGPATLRSGSFLPSSGTMEFDSADVGALEANGQFDEVIMHEMGHVLGIGTIWSVKSLVTGAGGSDPRYTGAQALVQYQSIFNTVLTTLPVENTGGPGTRDSHWRESVFNNEVMTGFLNSGGANPLSRITVASLADLGYVVNLAAAESYTPLFPAGLQTAPSAPLEGIILAIGDAFTVLDSTAAEATTHTNHLAAQGMLEAPQRTILQPLPATTRLIGARASVVLSPLPGTHLVTVNSGQITSGVNFGNQAFATVAGRHVFYSNSKFDGNDPAANAGDDAAIATDKSALLPGGTSSFANYTSFNRGLNGIMVDIANLPPGTSLSAGDFEFKVGNSDTPGGWTALAAAPTVSVRPGAGTSGSSRVTLHWPTGAAIKQWLQVTVKANANTGMATPDVFYFGNAVGESGNVDSDYSVSITDELLARNNPVSINPGTVANNRFDYNRDGTVSVVDQLLARNNITTAATRLRQITVPSALQVSSLNPQALSELPLNGEPISQAPRPLPSAPSRPNGAESSTRGSAELSALPSSARPSAAVQRDFAIAAVFASGHVVSAPRGADVADDLLELLGKR